MIERREKRKNNMRIPQRKEGYTVKNFLFFIDDNSFCLGSSQLPRYLTQNKERKSENSIRWLKQQERKNEKHNKVP